MEDKKLSKDELDEAVYIVESYINGSYKSIYLMDAWLKLKGLLIKEN